MRIHKIMLFLLLFAPLISAAYTSTYNLEKPWEYQSWRCASDAVGMISCESRNVVVYDWPSSHAYSCGCSDGHCDTCYECIRMPYFISPSRLGYSKGAWNINAFEAALDEMELYCFSHSSADCTFMVDNGADVSILSSLSSAYAQRTNAQNYADRCKNSDTYPAHNALFGGTISFNQYRAIMAPGGSRAPYPCTSSEPGSYAGPYCKGYYIYWQNSVSYAFTAITNSFNRADSKVNSQARPLWDRMQKSGICDDDYDWDLGGGCSEMKSAFGIIDGGIREGTYGQYNIAKDYLAGLQKDVWNYPPDLENYTRAMKLLWQSENGTISLFTKLIEQGNEAMDNAEEVYSGFISEANTYKTEVNTKYSKMESEKISMIHEAVAVEQIKENLTKEIREHDALFHFAADPDVRSSATSPMKSFNQNVIATFKVLETCRKNKIRHIVFASTSTVYGEAETIPTPEDYPCAPISNYGASKLACEAYLSSYAHSYGIKTTIVRYANIYGERSNHGVMYDFYNKLKENPKELKILGDGKQEKSYLHVEDCVSGTLAAFEKQDRIYDIFNIGSSEKSTVDEIAKKVGNNMKLKPKFSYTGGTRGWTGDVPLMLLDTNKIEALGWSQKISLSEGIKRYVKWLERKAKK